MNWAYKLFRIGKKDQEPVPVPINENKTSPIETRQNLNLSVWYADGGIVIEVRRNRTTTSNVEEPMHLIYIIHEEESLAQRLDEILKMETLR